MRQTAIALFCMLAAHSATAQQPPLQQMQNNINTQAAMEMMACIQQNVGMESLQELQSRGQAIQDQIQKLCHTNQRDRAQKYAIEEGMKLQHDPAIRKLSECSKDMIDQMGIRHLISRVENNEQHVCDLK